jgi:ribosome recycling factor
VENISARLSVKRQTSEDPDKSGFRVAQQKAEKECRLHDPESKKVKLPRFLQRNMLDMSAKQIVEEHDKNMAKSVEFLQNELRAVRTGMASSGLVENLMVDYYGNKTPLKQLATIATPEVATIVIKPFDPASLKDVEKAIRSSNLNLNPITDSKIIRLNMPPLSVERRTQLTQQVKQMGEKVKVTIRNTRRDANKHLDEEQKGKVITEDECDKAKKDIDNLTKEYADKVDMAVKTKSDEIMSD